MGRNEDGFSLVELVITLSIFFIVGLGVRRFTMNLAEDNARIMARSSADRLSQQIFSLVKRDILLLKKQDKICTGNDWCTNVTIPFYEDTKYSQFEASCKPFSASPQLSKVDVSAFALSQYFSNSAIGECSRKLNCPSGTMPSVSYFRGQDDQKTIDRQFPSHLDRSNPRNIRSQPIGVSLCAKSDLNGVMWVSVDVVYLDQANSPKVLSKSQSFSNVNFGGMQHVK